MSSGSKQEMVLPPTLRRQHLDDARLFADRHDLIRSLDLYRGGRVAELGVALGDFSRFMMDELKPRRFDAFDLFQLHHATKIWGRDASEYFKGATHGDFFRSRFASEIKSGALHMFEGDSSTLLGTQEDQSYDVIYIDADHTHEGVARDATVAAQKLRPDGLLIFNDYILFSHAQHVYYGIVPLVNDWCVNRGWKITHFALQATMWCDIAISRHPRKRWHQKMGRWLSRG